MTLSSPGIPTRLHRRPVELERYIDVCDKHRVADHSVQTGQLGAVARYESEHKSERVRRKHHEIAQQGGWHGGVRCVGYEADGMTIRDSEAAETRRFADAVGDWFTRLGRGPRA